MINLCSRHSSSYSRRGVTMVEILIVSVIIALLSAVSFPVYKIVQQRVKERRLKTILLNVRAAIAGSKSQKNSKIWKEGYRCYVYRRGSEEIWELHQDNLQQFHEAKQYFINDGTQNGMFYPLSPSHMIANQPYAIAIATGPVAGDQIILEVQQRFLRKVPPHPFKGWYPNARWEFKPVVNAAAGGPTYASGPADPWNVGLATGVVDIVSRGAGIALDGSKTDDW